MSGWQVPSTAQSRVAAVAALAAVPATAVRRVIYTDEAYYADVARSGRDPFAAREWSLGVDGVGVGVGCYGEFTLQWLDLSLPGLTWRLSVFGDGIGIAVDSGFIELMAGLDEAQPDAVKAALAAAGWVDQTPRVNPWPVVDMSCCAACGHDLPGQPGGS